MHEADRSLFRKPVYRILFSVVSPERLVAGVERRWSAFRRGTMLSALERGRGFVKLRLTHPPKLCEDHARWGVLSAIRAAIEATGGRCTDAYVSHCDDERTDYSVEWV